MTQSRNTYGVDESLFRQVYESPASLPGAERWVTPEEDVRRIEKLLGIPPETIGAPLWLSGDRKACPNCGRHLSWLDIVSSALGEVHEAETIARVILGEQKYVNVEAPDAIAGVRCSACQTAIGDLRSFKCHNWAYAVGDLARVVEQMARDR
jgi:hypothetical protein